MSLVIKHARSKHATNNAGPPQLSVPLSVCLKLKKMLNERRTDQQRNEAELSDAFSRVLLSFSDAWAAQPVAIIWGCPMGGTVANWPPFVGASGALRPTGTL